MTTTPLPHMALFPSFAGIDNPALTAALDALPGHDETQTAKARIADAIRDAANDLLTVTRARMILVEDVVAAAQAGKPLPRGFAQRATDTDAALTAARAAVEVLRGADSQLAHGRDQLLAAAPSALLRHLDEQLQAALTEARSLGLETVSSAQDAINADMVAAWRRHLELADIYASIRSAQHTVVTNLSRGNQAAQLFDTFAAVRNYAAVFPEWFDAQCRIPTGTVNGEPVYPTPQWSTDEPTGLWTYAVQHPNVELWVPTDNELQQSYATSLAEARQRRNQLELESDPTFEPPRQQTRRGGVVAA